MSNVKRLNSVEAELHNLILYPTPPGRLLPRYYRIRQKPSLFCNPQLRISAEVWRIMGALWAPLVPIY